MRTHLKASLILVAVMGLANIAMAAGNSCPADEVLKSEKLGAGTFGITGGPKVIGELKERFEVKAANEKPQVVQDNQNFLIFEAPVFVLDIKPTSVKSGNSCSAYAKTHVFKKVFEEASANEAECKGFVEGTVSDWVQGTLVGSASRWVSGDTPEGDKLFAACPDPCSYSSSQENIYSYDGRVCQIRVQLSVTCGAPKAKNEFQASGTYQKKAVCLSKTGYVSPKPR